MQTFLNILTIIAFVFSTYTFVKDLIEKRKNLSVNLLQVAPGFTGDYQSYSFCFQISNKSRLPIAITKIQVQTENQIFELLNAPITLLSSVTKQNEVITDTKKIEGSVLPINFASLGAERIYLTSYKETNFFIAPTDKIKIHISTNRGKIIKNVDVPNFCDLIELYPNSLPERQ